MDASDPEVFPKFFGKYRLLRKIATGGMAEIFLASDTSTNGPPLVVKRILPNLLESPEFVSMFLDEARIAAQLHHPNIVQIHDIGHVDGSYFMAMEYVHGEDIRRIYNQAYRLQRALPLSHSIRVIAEAARGLDHAHRLTDFAGRPMGLVHRDVSPQNILVTYEGHVKVVDFGIAKVANKVNQTRHGVLKGKYSYMSPEQAAGDAIDARTDLFALGVILFETTTGTRLFKRPTELATLQAVMKCEVPSPSTVLTQYPHGLEQIVLRVLCKNKKDRYPDAASFSQDLFRFLQTTGLYVEPAAIADFMRDLFSDRLADEARLGLGAATPDDEARAEMEVRPGSVAVGSLGESSAVAVPREDRGVTAPSPWDEGNRQAANASSGEHPSSSTQDTVLLAAHTPRGPIDERNESMTQRTEAENVRSTVADSGAFRQDQGSQHDAGERESAVLPPDSTEFVRSVVTKDADPDDLKRISAARVQDNLQSARRDDQHDAGAKKESSLRSTQAASRAPTMVHRRAPPRRRVLLAVVGLATAALVGVVVVSRVIGIGPFDPKHAGHDDVAAQGELRVTTLPGAQIWHDEKLLGTADATGNAGPFAMNRGETVVMVVVPEKGFSRSRVVDVRPGGVHEIEVRVGYGSLRIAVSPWAHVKIDQESQGMTPLPAIRLSEGAHDVELENPDIGRRFSTKVHIQADSVFELKVDLQNEGEPKTD